MNLTQRSLIALSLLATLAGAQTKPASSTAKAAGKPVAKPVATTAASTSLPTEDTVNSFLYQMFGYEPALTWKVVEIRPGVAGLTEVTVVISNSQGQNLNRLYVTPDGKHVITGEIIPFGAKPFEEARLKLEKGVNGPAKGPVKAPVTIVEFSDFQCPHCKEEAPLIEQLLALEPDAHFVFQNFPLPSHNWAEKAAGYADCIGRSSNDAVWKFVQKTFEQQASITEANADEKLKAIASDAGLKGDEIVACAAKPETKARIEASIALGKSVGVSGTPTLFINGRAISGGVPVDVLKKVVDFHAQEAGEKQASASSTTAQ